jgi:bacterioferritin-associated ferredoxin
MFACVCRGITESEVRRAGRAGTVAPDELVARFGLDDELCCGQCVTNIDEFVDLALEGADIESLLTAGSRALVAAR